DGGGREGEAAGEIQLARGLVPRGLHRNEGQARVDRERRQEVPAAVRGADDAHRRLTLLARERDVDVERAASRLERRDAHQRDSLELDARHGGAGRIEDGVVEPLDDRVGAVELAGGSGLERQALEGHTAGEGRGALAEEAGGYRMIGEVVERPAVG